MNFKDRYLSQNILHAGVVLVVTVFSFHAVFFANTPVAHGICFATYQKIYSYLTQAIKDDVDQATIFRVIGIIAKNTTECDAQGNATGPIVNDGSFPGISITPPDVTNASELEYAIALDALAHASCFHDYIASDDGGADNPDRGIVSGVAVKDNISCIDSFSGVMSSNAVQRFKDYQYLTETNFIQCVTCMRGFAAARNRPYTVSGNAAEHACKSASGYTYISKDPNDANNPDCNYTPNYESYLIPGSLFVRKSGKYGHVGVIANVERDDLTGEVMGIQVFDCNGAYKNRYARGHIYAFTRYTFSDFDGWYMPNSL